jgi:asparagine synthase (glutamine-hydrolysing)
LYALSGIISKNDQSISQYLISMMQEQSINKEGHYGLAVENKVFNGKLNDLNVKAIEGIVGLGCVPLKKQYAPIYRDCSKKLTVIYDGIIYDFKKKLSKDHNLVKTTDADIITHLLEENYSGGDLAFAAKKTLGHLEGGFSVAATDNNEMVAARDPVGFRTLYYGENDSFYAIATTKKALWRVGIPTVFRLPAGSMIHINKNFIDVSKIFPEERFGVEISIKDPRTAIDRYQEALCAAVERMLNGLDKAAILLSGGVDSCLLAKILKGKSEKLDVDLVGYTIGLEGSSDLKFAEDFAGQIGLPVKSKTVTIDDLNEALPKVIGAVEERDYVQIETSLIPYLAIEQVAKDSIRVVFLGQGPDEMWGGYPWYPRLLKEWGYAKLHEIMWEDLIRGDVETLARENKVARMFDIEVRYPYLDIDVIKTAMSVAPQLKIISDKDALGKRIHRSLAKKLGLPADAVERKKTAAQHGSGIHQVLLQLANRHGFNDKLVAKLNYSPTKISTEKLGSSSRYGYKYGDRDMWLIPSCIQLYFDYLAYKEGLLNDPERTKISTVLGDVQSFDQDVKQLIKRRPYA